MTTKITKKTSFAKLLFIMFVFASVAHAELSSLQTQQYDLFKTWTIQQSKQYSVDEAPIRFSNWKNNHDFVQQQNAKNLSYQLGMNQFADMTTEEFSAIHLGFKASTGLSNNLKSSEKSNFLDFEDDNSVIDQLMNVNVSAAIDWRNRSAVTPVKDEGTCGSCWAFSTTGALEGLYAINNRMLLNFSEQQLVDCSTEGGNDGCNGGTFDGSFDYIQVNGIELEADYPYKGSGDTCQYSSDKAVFKNNGYVQLPQNNVTLMKAVVNLQPLAVGVKASDQAFQLYESGVLTDNCDTDIDFSLLIVGYNTTSDGTEYWIAKNQWGTSWGLEGYIQIAIGYQNSGSGLCGINTTPTYPTF